MKGRGVGVGRLLGVKESEDRTKWLRAWAEGHQQELVWPQNQLHTLFHAASLPHTKLAVPEPARG